MQEELTSEALDELINQKIEEEEIKSAIKLDYSIESPQERKALVQKIIDSTPLNKLTNKYLEILSDYLIYSMDKAERKKKKILTDNRMVTVNKREVSFQGLAGRLENGEDGIYNMITNDKNIIFSPKVSITKKDLEEIPYLKDLKEAIAAVEKAEKAASGKKKYQLKKQLIELHQDQYTIKNAYRKPIFFMNTIKSFSKLNLDEQVTITASGDVVSSGLINLFNPAHVSTLLCYYSNIKEDSWDKFNGDSYYLMEDLDNLIESTLKDKYPLYYDLLIYKIDGKSNAVIQSLLYKKYNIKHSIEYISSLWRQKIPKLLAESAKEQYLIWYYTNKECGKWKKCSRCGQIKLAHRRFFSINNTSKDGFYSICKECRNKR